MIQVTLNSVNKTFGKTHVIRNVDLEIEKGEFVVFVGPSGCGKSTLLRLVAGLETLSSGTIASLGVLSWTCLPRNAVLQWYFNHMLCTRI